MELVRPHIGRRWPDGLQAGARTPIQVFAAAALALGGLLIPVVALWSGAGVFATIMALLSFAVTATIAGLALHRSYPHGALGLCNAITLARLALAMALIAPLVADVGTSWVIFTVAVIALTLDGFDGWLARRQGFVSQFGARFDMEVDSALALVLALSAAVAGGAGVLAIFLGLPRYLFVGAAWLLPWMGRDLPERFSRKAVCVLQLSALIVLQSPILPEGLAIALVLLVAASLAWSFSVDVAWLWRRRA